MKIKSLLLTIMVVATMASCDRAPTPAPVVGYVSIKLVISNGLSRSLTRTTTDSNLFPEESGITTLRIITFDSDGKLDKNYFIPEPSTEVRVLVLQSIALNVYIIANEPTNLTRQLGKITHKSALADIEYQMADYFTKEAAFSYGDAQSVPDAASLFSKLNLPMSANQNINTLTNAKLTYGFEISRALARVDVWVRKKEAGITYRFTENSTLEYNTYGQGRIFNVNNNTLDVSEVNLVTKTVKAQDLSITPAAGTTPNNDALGENGGYKRVFTFYTPERKNADPARLQITMKNLIYGADGIVGSDNISFKPVVLAQNITTIERNYVYSMYCSITELGSITLLGCIITPWGKKDIDVPSFD